MKDCFDGCKETSCWLYGHEPEYIPEYCLADPIIDRYEKRKSLKRPCNTGKHRDIRLACSRCIHRSDSK